MASSSMVTLSSVIDEALGLLYRATERPAQANVGADALTSSSADTTMTLTGSITPVQNSTVLECGQELLLVTNRSADATPIFTVARGYAGTPVAAHVTGDVVLVSPLWTRYETRRAALRAFLGPLTSFLPNITTVSIATTTNQYYLAIPAECIEVLRVAVSQVSGASQLHWDEISQWQYSEDIPTTVVSTGKMVTFPYGFPAGQTVHVTYQSPYIWTVTGGGGSTTNDPAEADTMSMPIQALDLPALYAAAYQITNREITRLEIDRIEEWNQDAAIRQGVNLRMAQSMWQQFYRRLDEAKRVQNVPRHRPYRPMRTMTNGRWTNGRSWRNRSL